MTKLATSAMGLLLLNPICCTGTAPSSNGDSGVGGAVVTGGAGGVTRCDISDGIGCPPNQICVQTMFPIMPPQGFDGGMGPALLGECRPVSQGGGGSTGGVGNAGGSSGTTESNGGKTTKASTKAGGGSVSTGGTTAVMYPILPLSTGGRTGTGGTTAVIYPILPQSRNDGETQSHDTLPHERSVIEGDSWWQTAEAALRRT